MSSTQIRNLVNRTRQCDAQELGRDSIIYVDISSVSRETKRISSPQLVPVGEAPSRARKLIEKDDVLVSTVRPNLNSVALVPAEYDHEIASTGFCVLRANRDRLDPAYLFYFTQTNAFVSRLTRLSIGAGYPAVSDSDILDAEIPLRPLPEQKRIAAILAKADRLCRLRRYALEVSEGYLQAVFLEMFGDPVRNPKGWPRASVSELGCVQTGNTPPRADAENYGDHIEWIKSDNVQNDRVYVSPSREMLSEKGVRRGRVVEAGSALVTCIAGSITSVGDVALTDRRVAYNQQINAITPRPGVDPFFLYGLLKAAQRLVRYNATAGMKHIITKSRLESLVLIRPPRRLQQHFGQIVGRHERLCAQQREAVRQAEQLFGALLHRAFQGEL